MNVKPVLFPMVILLLFQTNPLTSQEINRSEIGVMVTGGIKNWGLIPNNDYLLDNGVSAGVGILLEHLLIEEIIGVQIGVLFRNRGDCEEWAYTDRNGDPLGTDRVNYTKGDVSFPITIKFNFQNYYLGVGAEAGANIINRTKGDLIGLEKNDKIKDAAIAWHSKAGLRKELSETVSLMLELEYVNNWKEHFTNFHFGIGLNYKLAS